MAFLLMKLRPYGHYAMIIFPAMSILFAVFHESRNELQKIWQTSGLSFKRILLKIFIILAVIDIYMSSCCIKELCLNEESTLLLFAPTVNRKVIELNSNEHEEILKLTERTHASITARMIKNFKMILLSDKPEVRRIF